MTSCRTARSESYEFVIIVVLLSGNPIMEAAEVESPEPTFFLPRRLAAASGKTGDLPEESLGEDPSRECCPATASYNRTACPTSRNRLAVSASRAIFCANATLTKRELSVIKCATFLKTYRGKIDASDGGKVVTAE
jgi:hypothetical protein